MKIKKNREKGCQAKRTLLAGQLLFFRQMEDACMAKYMMALDAEQPATAVFFLMKRGKKSVWHRKNLPSIFQNQAGWNMMQMKSGQASLELR